MKDPYPRVFPIWFIPLMVLIAFSLMQCGCRTGGKWIKSGSSGIKQVITPSDLERQPNGTFKLKPKNTGIPSGKPGPYESPKITSTPVKIKSAVAKPAPPKPVSAKAEKLPPANVKSSGLSTVPFKPTVTPRLEEKVNVKPIENPPAKIVDGGCVVITDNEGKPTVPREELPKEKPTLAVDWLELFLFYFLGIMALVFAWIVYDIWREYKKIKPKEKKAPTKRKKPAKKATSKKAPTKRKRGRPKKKSS